MSSEIDIAALKNKNFSIVETILRARGIENFDEYFNPEEKPFSSPDVFSDIDNAVSIIKNAISNNENILIWGDFDADGVTSTAILIKALTALGANFTYFLPDRANLGHGINLKELLKLKSKNNTKVLITVDCGISNSKEIELIKSMGVKTIITDHHEAPETLPPADCILNPHAPNSLRVDLSFEEIKKVSEMSGAGVSMKLAYAILDDKYEDVKKEILALACVGTIADVVPLVGENRVIVARGLVEINSGVHKGISKLFEEQEFKRAIKSEDIAFILAPRINAAGRLDSPFLSIKLLVENNPITLDVVIEKLNSLNKVRQNLCDKIYEDAIGMLKNPDDSIVLYNDGWHLGIIGVVASRLVEKFNLPVFLISKDEKGIFRCSIRGTSQYDVSRILKSMEDCFVAFGGHALAGGFSADPEAIDVDTLCAKIKETVSNSKDDTKAQDKLVVDIELDEEDINEQLFCELEKMEPFGAENKKPRFLFRDAKVLSQRTMGKSLNHLAFMALKGNKNFECVCWKRKILGINNGSPVSFVFKPEVNSFNGEERVQLVVDFILNDPLQQKCFSSIKFFDHRQKTGILEKVEGYVAQKNGEVRILASSVFSKKALEKYPSILKYLIEENFSKEKAVMMFDYPPTREILLRSIKKIRPDNVHIMKSWYSKNPDEYIKTACGIIKYATNAKQGKIDITAITKALGVDEPCVNFLLELLEKKGAIQIDDVDKMFYIKAPHLQELHEDAVYELFCDELKRVNDFKDYLSTAPLAEIEELCR